MTEKQLKAIISSMTIEEKLAQMTQLNPVCFGFKTITPLTGPDVGLRVPEKVFPHIGSVLNCDNAEAMTAIQKKHMEEDPHSIPLLFMADIIHGFKTIFPIPLALSCSFSEDYVEEVCRISALESAVSGIHVTFSPMGDLVRDPRWGRVMEAWGEDPLLGARLSAAAVKGYQGGNPAKQGRMSACVKHFAAYGAAEGGREYNTVDISCGTLCDLYLSSYHAALQAGAGMVMSGFNSVDRVPATANRQLLQGILREEWGFEGPVISDFNSVGELIEHGVAAGGAEAAYKSMAAGVDIEMMSPHYTENGKALLAEAKISEQMVDQAVMRILLLKNRLGLFENPYKDADPDQEKKLHLCCEHRQAARNIAAHSMVLLKNEGKILPLSGNQMIGLTGPYADSQLVVGSWSAGSKSGISLYEGLCTEAHAFRIHKEDCGMLGSLLEGFVDIPPIEENFAARFADCKTVIVAVGEHQDDTGEGASKTNLRLSPNQEALIKKLKIDGKQVVTIIFSGRPLEILPILPYSDAVIQAWFPGTESGNALSDILSGKSNPSGRLSISFPRTVGQIPVYYNHFRTGRPELPEKKGARYTSRYLDCPVEPLYCFGYGLSYSEFEYSNLAVTSDQGISVCVRVKNISEVEGTETVQFYITDETADVIRPVKELKNFQRITLKPGESQSVIFHIFPETLSFYKEQEWVFEKGLFEIMAGHSSEELLSERVYIDKMPNENTLYICAPKRAEGGSR